MGLLVVSLVRLVPSDLYNLHCSRAMCLIKKDSVTTDREKKSVTLDTSSHDA